ncbi:MAG: bifunctional DNA primase/polymerase [Chloroflexi bacterium]|nr:bifunctional DNA primase/polymerase [Chloroflexota bacterium]
MHATATAPGTTEEHRRQTERTIARFERLGIATFPSAFGRKGSHLTGWPGMAAPEAVDSTRNAASAGRINVAGRTGDGVAVLDLDAKDGVQPTEMLEQLRQLLGPAIIAIVRTSRGYHVWLKVTASVGNGFCAFIGGDIFSGPHLAMLPPSMHPSGSAYGWELEPRAPERAADLRSLGLVPDAPATTTLSEGNTAVRPAESALQEEFARLMADVAIHQPGGRAQTLHRCPWHNDRTPSLSINWEAAVFYCFSTQCGQRGGVRELRRLLGINTPTYGQRAAEPPRDMIGAGDDHLSGDNSGCLDIDASVERLASALADAGDDLRASAVRACRSLFRVGTCTSCGQKPAFPISCGHPLCPRCMPGRLAADWKRHRAALPEELTVLRLVPRGLTPKEGVLRTTRRRFAEWRKRSGVAAGIYGSTLDAEHGAVIMLAIPRDLSAPASTRGFAVEVVGERQSPDDFLTWLRAEYLREACSWSTTEEFDLLTTETRGRRRFQGFGGAYGEANRGQEEAAMDENETMKKDESRPLSKISGGGGTRSKAPHTCMFCGGEVELYPFTVPASEVVRFGEGWLWKGAQAGPPEGRRYAR